MHRLRFAAVLAFISLLAAAVCNSTFDALLGKALGVTDVAARQAAYRQVVDIYLRDLPHIVLYHARWLWALSNKVSGFVPTPDGLIRPQGMAIAQ